MSLEGLFVLPWWGYVVVALGLTHITIASVTIYFHRHQAHRALDLHPVVAHFFRFWLWLTTGNVTKEWVAVHRKHHAKVETPDDPHSPQQFGLKKVLWDGVTLYRQATADRETLEKYGHDTPDDWIERHLYTPRSSYGLWLMLIIDLVCFGPIGLTIWAVQMLWIPLFAAGVINGLGHAWGYRNYEVADASHNVFPWGVLIGGEELHNNHHAFGSSARMSAKWYEFDIGWFYIRLLEVCGLARVKKTLPRLACTNAKAEIDRDTVKAVVQGRFIVLAQFVRTVLLKVYREELRKTKRADRESWAFLKRAERLLVREPAMLKASSRAWLQSALSQSQALRQAYAMKERRAELWRSPATTQEQLVEALRAWCREAEATGIEALQGFARRLRTYRLAPA